jgi:hypothetical protein
MKNIAREVENLSTTEALDKFREDVRTLITDLPDGVPLLFLSGILDFLRAEVLNLLMYDED